MANGRIEKPEKEIVKWHVKEIGNYGTNGVTDIPWRDVLIAIGVIRRDNASSYALCGAMADDNYFFGICMTTYGDYLRVSFTDTWGWGRFVYALRSENTVNT